MRIALAASHNWGRRPATNPIWTERESLDFHTFKRLHLIEFIDREFMTGVDQ